MIERHVDWPSRLNLYLIDVQKRIPNGELDYITLDCCRFVADGVVAMTGTDLFKKYRKRYKSKIGAARVLKRLGGLRTALGSILGEEIHKAMACHGDIVFWDGACGWCLGRKCLFLSDAGFSLVPTLKIDCAFHV